MYKDRSSCARLNRSVLIRVPESFLRDKKVQRVELRCLDSSFKPYLAFSTRLKAGLEGIKKKIGLPEPLDEDLYEFEDSKLAEFYKDFANVSCSSY